MEESQVSNKPKGGCGCRSGNVNQVNFSQKSFLNKQQEELLAKIQKTNRKKNSIYKTQTRLFL